MRTIEWKMTIDPNTFIPVVVCLLDGKSTKVCYGPECVLDESVNFSKEEIVRCVKLNLEQDFKQRTDMTEEEIEFALSRFGNNGT